MMTLRLRSNHPGFGFDANSPRSTASSVIAVSFPLGTEDPDQQDHHAHHGDRSDHADRGGEALPPEAELERLVIHEDRPGVGRRGAVEAAEYEIFVDHPHRR